MPKALSEVYSFTCARWVGLEWQKMAAKEDILQTTANLALNFLTLSLFLQLQMKLQTHFLCKAGRKGS